VAESSASSQRSRSVSLFFRCLPLIGWRQSSGKRRYGTRDRRRGSLTQSAQSGLIASVPETSSGPRPSSRTTTTASTGWPIGMGCFDPSRLLAKPPIDGCAEAAARLPHCPRRSRTWARPGMRLRRQSGTWSSPGQAAADCGAVSGGAPSCGPVAVSRRGIVARLVAVRLPTLPGSVLSSCGCLRACFRSGSRVRVLRILRGWACR
jgi:hypothetical protein